MKIFKQIKKLLPKSPKRLIRDFINHKYYNYPYEIKSYDDYKLARLYNTLDTHNKTRLIQWLRFKAGSQNAIYFKTRSINGLMLQQIPEEYANFLMWLRRQEVENYLEIGVGSGSSFFINNIFMKDSVKISCAVDNFSYTCFGNQSEEVNKKISLLKLLNKNCQYNLINDTSQNFFKSNPVQFDLIFIDGDHSYEGVRADYEHALSALGNKGNIIFHDIVSKGCPGVTRLWKEIKTEANVIEFIAGDTCGIGIIKYG